MTTLHHAKAPAKSQMARDGGLGLPERGGSTSRDNSPSLDVGGNRERYRCLEEEC